MMVRSLILVVAVAAAGCLEVDPPNKPPTASVQVLVNNEAATVAPPMMGVVAPAYMAAPGQTVTLNGMASADPDGTIAKYEWFRTDVSRGMRTPPTMAPPAGGTGAAGMGAAGMGAGGMGALPPPPFTGDPPGNARVDVMVPVAGNYRYSLWVTDNGGLASAPATVTLVVR